MGGHDAEAVPQLERAVALNPKLTNARVVLGSSYLAIGEPAQGCLSAATGSGRCSLPTSRTAGCSPRPTPLPSVQPTHWRELRKITEIAPRIPAGWYALGHGYNAVAQDSMATFNDKR